MILVPLLVFLSGSFIYLAVNHLNQSLLNYYDFVALVMVLGGTFSVGLVLVPWEYRKDLWAAIKSLLSPEQRRYKTIVNESLELIKSGKVNTSDTRNSLYSRILKDGFELIHLGFEKERLASILNEKVFQSIKRKKKISMAVKGLSKYPPAFGLMGTVLGLVNIMKHLAGATDASKLGVEMSVALVATMYGLLIANFVIQPVGEILMKKAEEEEEYAEIAVQAIICVKEQMSYIESQEVLNAMVPDEQRMSLSAAGDYEGAA